MTKSRARTEFGDFQTPEDLAARAVAVVRCRGVRPAAVVEPTCGVGTFLVAALEGFPDATRALGIEVNPAYLAQAKVRVMAGTASQKTTLREADFFAFDWSGAFRGLPEPILIIGNPPWVTASELGSLKSANVPVKSNFQERSGFDAITGKSNFDIAEWMLIRLLECVRERCATVAMLIKTTVARRVLLHVWQANLPVAAAAIYTFDAGKHFGVSVDACLLVCDVEPGTSSSECAVSDLEHPNVIQSTIGYEQGALLADKDAYQRLSHLRCRGVGEPLYRWRSGVKHDCAPVMELRMQGKDLRNGLGEVVQLEDAFLYPMRKGSEVARGAPAEPSRFMIVTQRHTGQDTRAIADVAPMTWRYLCDHAERLDKRRSSIYRNRPRFSVFGVGPYTFALWKVAICGLYKKLDFVCMGPSRGKPVVLDDTCYFLPCGGEAEARLLAALLNSQTAHEFFGAFVFWDAKRPITAQLLGRLDLVALAQEEGLKDRLVALRPGVAATADQLLF